MTFERALLEPISDGQDGSCRITVSSEDQDTTVEFSEEQVQRFLDWMAGVVEEQTKNSTEEAGA